MFINLVFVGIFYQIQDANSACSVNYGFNRLVTSVYDIKLCVDRTCTVPKYALKPGEIYTHCVYHDSSPINSFIIQIAKAQSATPFILTKCLSNIGWIDKRPNYACPETNSIQFSSYPILADDEVYVVQCSDAQMEFANEDVPQLQIVGFESGIDGKAPKTHLVYPTQNITCVANCKEVIPQWTVSTGANLVENVDNVLIIKIVTPTTTGLEIQIHGECKHQGSKPKSIYMYVADKITSNTFCYTNSLPRKPPNMYDAGEVITCTTSGNNSKVIVDSYSIPKTYIALVRLDEFGNILGNPFNSDPNVLVIQENITVTGGGLGIICYLGNYSYQVGNLFIILKNTKIAYGSRFLTKVQSETRKVQTFDFFENEMVSCVNEYYGREIGVNPTLMYVNPIAFPRSIISNYNVTLIENALGNVVIFTSKPGCEVFILCNIGAGGETTTPVQVFGGDRPSVNFTSIHPNWPTEYHLVGFIIMCLGANIDDILLTCIQCQPDTNIFVKKIDFRTIRLEIPPTILKYTELIYKCTGISSKYSSVSVNLNLKIIASEMSSVAPPDGFYLYGKDFLRCISSFTVFENRMATQKSISIPLQMKINADPLINKDGKSERVFLSYNNKTLDELKMALYFRGCCPSYFASIYTCNKQWSDVLVAKDYRVEYNLDFNNIYPGNLLKCHICTNYTSDLFPGLCIGERLIKSKIKMRVKYPNGYENETMFLDEVNMPLEGLKPDGKSYYSISDYIVHIGCSIQGIAQMILLKLKSCQTNPPAIYITPVDKTMYLVGDIFSCTTDSLNCKTALTYDIAISKNNIIISNNINQGSYTFLPRDVGNNIKITCTTKTLNTTFDTRTVRVEMKPANVSIQLVQKIMVYKKFLRCKAHGFPKPSISWTQLKGPSTLINSEAFILIGPWDFPGEYTIQCEARNERGSTTASSTFKVFNPRIFYTDYSASFYFFIPLMAFIYLILIMLSMAIIFQESVFGVPFFCGGKNLPIKHSIKQEEPLMTPENPKH